MTDIPRPELACAPSQDSAPSPEPSPSARILALYEAHAASVARYAASLCGDGQIAMEATQQAFVELVQSRGEESPEPWLYHRVSQILTERGALAQEPARQAPPPTEASADILAWLSGQEVLARLRTRLSPREFEMVALRLGGASYTQISRSLDVSIGTVASTLARAIKKARVLLHEEKQ